MSLSSNHRIHSNYIPCKTINMNLCKWISLSCYSPLAWTTFGLSQSQSLVPRLLMCRTNQQTGPSAMHNTCSSLTKQTKSAFLNKTKQNFHRFFSQVLQLKEQITHYNRADPFHSDKRSSVFLDKNVQQAPVLLSFGCRIGFYTAANIQMASLKFIIKTLSTTVQRHSPRTTYRMNFWQMNIQCSPCCSCIKVLSTAAFETLKSLALK